MATEETAPPTPAPPASSIQPPPQPAAQPAATTAPAPAPEKKSRRVPPEVFARRAAVADAGAVFLVLVFAFLLACFPVNNSDFFQFLATGRLIAHGDYTFGKDPFTI